MEGPTPTMVNKNETRITLTTAGLWKRNWPLESACEKLISVEVNHTIHNTAPRFLSRRLENPKKISGVKYSVLAIFWPFLRDFLLSPRLPFRYILHFHRFLSRIWGKWGRRLWYFEVEGERGHWGDIIFWILILLDTVFYWIKEINSNKFHENFIILSFRLTNIGSGQFFQAHFYNR